MAIILCPECKNKISSKAKTCPNCGCPIETSEIMRICKINGVDYDFTDFYNRLITIKRNNDGFCVNDEFNLIMQEVRKFTNLASTFGLCRTISTTEEVPAQYNGETVDDFRKQQRLIQASKPKCPHCHSTNILKISGTERAMSVIGLGILSKKMNKSFKCKSCGYTW